MNAFADGLLTVSEERARARVGIKWTKHSVDVIPSFVADMDFDPPQSILNAIQGHVERGDLGYGPFSAELAPAYADWQERQHGWRPDERQIRPFTSALHALEVALWNTTERGDGVLSSLRFTTRFSTPSPTVADVALTVHSIPTDGVSTQRVSRASSTPRPR